MAMITYFQMVSADELAELVDDPAKINGLNQSPEQSLTVRFQQTDAYFLCGTGWPSVEEDGPLAGALMGVESVDAPTLENSRFGIVPPEDVADIVEAFDEVDLDELAAAVEAADLEQLLDEEELFDIEDFVYEEVDLAALICDEVRELAAFYVRASDDDLGVVLYTA